MKKCVLLIFILSVFIFASTACVKFATKAPKVAETTPLDTPEISFPLPGTADDVMSQLESFATQTAIAMKGPLTSQEAVSTPEAITTPEASEIVSTSEMATPAEKTTEVTSVPETKTSEEVKVPTATPGIPKTYTLKKGEHPYCIARRFNVNPTELLRLSGLGTGDTFPAGTELKIPQDGKPFPGDRSLRNHPTTYTVISGDTIYSIACIFGDVSPEAIAYANNIKVSDKLSPGDELKIP